MKRIVTLIALCCCTLVAAQAQLNRPEWTKNIGGSGWDWARCTRMIGTTIVTVGSTLSDDGEWDGAPSRAEDMFIVKTDIDGNTVWKKKFGGSGTDICYAVEPTADGGFLLAGSTTSTDGEAMHSGYHAGSNNPDYWIIKLNADGDIEWQKAFGGNGTDEAMGIAQTDDDGDGRRDDGYVIVGWTDSQDGDVTGNHGRFDTWVIKLSSAGDLEWQRCLGGSHVEYGRDIEQLADGGYVVVTETYSNDGEVTGFHAELDYPLYASSDNWIVKLDAAGNNIKWSKCIGGTYAEVPYEIKLTYDGGFIVSGTAESIDGNVPLPGYGGYDMLVMKFDFDGNIEWQQRLGGSGRDRAYSVIQALDGGYALLGTSNSDDGSLAGIDARGGLDFMLIKLDVYGNVEWNQNFGGSNDDEAMSLQQTPVGCYVIAGNSNSNDGHVPGNYGDADAWILNWCTMAAILPVKLGEFKARYEPMDRVVLEWTTETEQNNDRFEIQRSVDGKNFFTIGTVKSPGNAVNGIRYGYVDRDIEELETAAIYYRLRQVSRDGKVSVSQAVLVRLQTVHIGEIKIWPNPSVGKVKVQFKNRALSQVRATVYNANGQVVMTAVLQKATNEIDLTGKNKGTYFIRLEDGIGYMQMHQLILR